MIQDGKIAAIGTEISVPEGAQVIDAAGRTITPGLIEAHCHLGVSEQGIGSEGNDVNEMTDPATPHVRAIDGINPREEGFRNAIEAGITAAWVTPGSGNVIGGMATTIRTYGATVEQMILKEFSALKGALGENPKKVYAGKGKITTRMGNAAIFREWFYKAKAYLKKQEAARAKHEEPDFDLKLEPIAAVLRGDVPMRIHAHRADDIMTAIRLCNEFGVKFTIEHCTEGHLIVEQLKAQPNLVGVIIGPTMSAKSKVELSEKTWETAGILAKAGLRVALQTDHPVIPVQYLPLAGAYAVKNGMDPVLALRAITLSAAEIAGVADRVGSLEVGKDADIAIFTGHPFDVQTHTVATIIAGEVVYRNPKFA
ncbi:MAG: amidohydrolase [Firmicutes bacterium]|nr:amidohydrolase [Bacillota bacterium]